MSDCPMRNVGIPTRTYTTHAIVGAAVARISFSEQAYTRIMDAITFMKYVENQRRRARRFNLHRRSLNARRCTA